VFAICFILLLQWWLAYIFVHYRHHLFRSVDQSNLAHRYASKLIRIISIIYVYTYYNHDAFNYVISLLIDIFNLAYQVCIISLMVYFIFESFSSINYSVSNDSEHVTNITILWGR